MIWDDKADDLLKRLKEANTPAAAVIGAVRPLDGKNLVLR